MDSRASFGVIVAVFQYGWGVGLVNTAVVGADDGPQAIAALRPASAPSHDANPKAPAAHAALARNDRRAPVWVTSPGRRGLLDRAPDKTLDKHRDEGPDAGRR